MKDVSDFELRHLRHFIAVAEELHFRRAASRLGMTQPPLSHSIATLEAALGVELFDRTRRQIRLTDAGLALRDRASAVLASVSEAADTARAAAQGRIGRLRITYVGTASYSLLPRLVAAFRHACPLVTVEMTERTAVAQIEALLAGEADVGLIRMPIPDVPGLHVERIHGEPFLVALQTSHPLAVQESIPLSALAGDAFVMFPAREAPAFHAQIVGACLNAGFAMRISQEAVQMHAIVAMVAAGLGVALVPASLAHLHQPGVVYRACTLARPDLHAEIALAWRRADPSAVVTAFLTIARKETRGGLQN